MMTRKGEPRPDPTMRSIAGAWASDRGPVTIAHDPINGKEPVQVTGGLGKTPEQTFHFKNATFDPATGALTIETDENGTAGRAWLLLSPDGKQLIGMWSNAMNQRGSWEMSRK